MVKAEGGERERKQKEGKDNYKDNRKKNAPGKGIQDNHEFCIPRCGFWNPVPGIRILGFRIPLSVLRISKPRISDSTSENFPDSGFHSQKFPGSQGIHGATFCKCEICSSLRHSKWRPKRNTWTTYLRCPLTSVVVVVFFLINFNMFNIRTSCSCISLASLFSVGLFSTRPSATLKFLMFLYITLKGPIHQVTDSQTLQFIRVKGPLWKDSLLSYCL